MWRFVEIIGIFAAILDNNEFIYDEFDDSKNNKTSLRDVLLVAIIFNGTYLIVMLVEVVMYYRFKNRFNLQVQK